MLACKGGHAESVSVLLGAGADASLLDSASLSALHYAALHTSGACLVLLLNQISMATAGAEPPTLQEQKISK